MKRLISSLLVTLSVLLNSSAVFAADTFWSVTMSTPETPHTSRSFNVQYSTLSTDSTDTIEVELFQDGSSKGTQSVNAGGSGTFKVTVASDGSYSYKIVATNDAETKTTNAKTVVVDASNPVKANQAQTTFSGNTYTVTFTVPAQSDAVKARVYASTKTSFAPSEDTFVGHLTVTAGKNYDFTHKVASGAAKLYFIVQLVDKAGNVSNVVANPKVEETETNTVSAAEPEGRVAAKESGTTDDKAASTEKKDEKKADEKSSSWVPFAIVLVVGLVAGGYWWTNQKTEQDI